MADPTLHTRWLGAELKHLRVARDLTINAVISRLDWPSSKLSRIENGLVRAHWIDVRALLTVYGLGPDARRHEQLIELAKLTRQRSWWHSYTDVLPKTLSDLIALEASASRIDAYDTLRIPALLRTPDYEQALHSLGPMPGFTDISARRLREVQGARQELLLGDAPPNYTAIISEAALRQQIGGASVMREQVRHIIDLSKSHDHIVVRVLPLGSPVAAKEGYAPSVTLRLTSPVPLDVCYLECLTGDRLVYEDEVVARHRLGCRRLLEAAYSAEESYRVLARTADRMRGC
jgi:hypothetical protein